MELATLTPPLRAAERAIGIVGLLVLLAACAPRGSLALLPEGAPGGPRETVLVASSRAPDDSGQVLSRGRAAAPVYLSFDISIPPEREPGSVGYPGRRGADPKTDFLVAEAERLPDRAAFTRAVSGQIGRPGTRETDAVVFVHGFNNTFAEGLMRQAQLQHDMGRGGASVHFAWPSAAEALNYVYDRESALHGREAFRQTLQAVTASKAESFALFAHSMGAFVAMDTLWMMVQGGHPDDKSVFRKLDAVVLVSPDLEIDLFLQQAPAVLATGVPIYLIVSEGDRALRLSSFLRGEKERLGSIRSKEELGGLDVTVIDFSAVQGDAVGHFKVTSPAVAAYVRGVHASGEAAIGGRQASGVVTGDIAFEQDGEQIRPE